MKHFAKIQSEFNEHLKNAGEHDWWDKMNFEQREDYLAKHPKSDLNAPPGHPTSAQRRQHYIQRGIKRNQPLPVAPQILSTPAQFEQDKNRALADIGRQKRDRRVNFNDVDDDAPENADRRRRFRDNQGYRF